MLEDFKKEFRLKDTSPILVRPLTADDESCLLTFFSEISDHDKWFFRDETADPKALSSWIRKLNYGKILPLVAIDLTDNRIVGSIQLHRPEAECLRHIGHIRIMLHPDYRRKNLGPLMMQSLIQLAMDLGVERLAAELVEDMQEAAIRAATRLDFKPQATLEGYVKGPDGRRHNLIIMVKTLLEEWDDF